MKPATSIVKVCRIFEAFRMRASMGIKELSEETGLLPSDVHRIVNSLEPFGYMEQNPLTKKYKLGMEFLIVAHLVHQRIKLREIARPHLLRLSESTEATANLAVFDRRTLEIIFVEQIDSPSEVSIKARIGESNAPHCTSVGKILTAFMEPALANRVLKKNGLKKETSRTIISLPSLRREFEAIRSRGYATDHGEAVEGACCIGAPVRDYYGKVVAAVSISIAETRLLRTNEQRLISLVRDAAGKISRSFGYQTR